MPQMKYVEAWSKLLYLGFPLYRNVPCVRMSDSAVRECVSAVTPACADLISMSHGEQAIMTVFILTTYRYGNQVVYLNLSLLLLL